MGVDPRNDRVCGELLIFDTNLQFATHRFGLIERFTLFGRADLTAVDAATDQR
jgi:hypothetical protein